jgi:hypothetical protein
LNPGRAELTAGQRQRYGWIGAVCLLLIISVKAIRWADIAVAEAVVGVAPSVLGPAGLLFLLRSGTGWLGRQSLVRTTALAGVIALGLEFAQLLPRPGVLARVRYTFDWMDVAATLVSLAAAYSAARVMSGPRARS